MRKTLNGGILRSHGVDPLLSEMQRIQGDEFWSSTGRTLPRYEFEWLQLGQAYGINTCGLTIIEIFEV